MTTNLNSISASPSMSGIDGARSPEAASSDSVFSAVLSNQQQLDAARDVLATLPAPIVYSLRDRAGSPAETVDRLFEVLRDGSFTPPAGPLGAPDSIIGATARAATLFESPAQLWAAMRSAIADPVGLASTLRAAPAPAPTSTPPPTQPEVHTLEEAERLLAGLRPANPSTAHSDWWEAALRFLLGPKFPA